MDKIFSIAPLIDKSFLNISIKKSCTLRRYSFFYVIPLRFERKTHALEGLQVQSLFITDLQAIITHVKKNADKPFDKPQIVIGYRIAINILIHDKIKEEKDNMNAFPLFNYSYLTKQEISSLFFNLSRYNRTHFHININASCNPASSASSQVL